MFGTCEDLGYIRISSQRLVPSADFSGSSQGS